jgi:hypothetical protein
MSTHSTALRQHVGLFQWLRERCASAGRELPSEPSDDAASVRALADRYRRSDPGFASDLYAAADRHERAAEAAARR